ncbi:hypothetical protein ACIQ34_11400 [Ureibacillus sp. NPDC094379]
MISNYGIGGEEYSFQKTVDFIRHDSHEITEMKLDFGNLADWGINGLIGLDILINGKFTIDLDKLELVQNY